MVEEEALELEQKYVSAEVQGEEEK